VKLLVVGNDETMASSLRNELSLRHEQIEACWLFAPEWWSLDWKQTLTEVAPNFVVSLTFPGRTDAAALTKRLRKGLAQLADVCGENEIPLLHLSSVRVFDGDKNAPYQEGDAEAPFDELGALCLQLEEIVATHAKQFVILRTASIFSHTGDNLLTQTIRLAEQGRTLVFDPSLSGCPTGANDVARVIIAILLQLHCGADSWGVYHYTSSDVTTGYQFAEAVLAIASQFDRELNLDQVKLEERAVDDPDHLQLDPVQVSCQKLLNTFGIKQRPWRSQLTSVVRNYFGTETAAAGDPS